MRERGGGKVVRDITGEEGARLCRPLEGFWFFFTLSQMGN